MSTLARTIRRLVPADYRPIGYLTRLVRQQTDGCVRQGPFAGMRYVGRSFGSAYLPKLLGTYERELTPCVEAICERRPELIVDVGAAEGYYAVGLARRNPQARVIAFETDPVARRALLDLAQLNDMGNRVAIRGECQAADLAAALDGAERPAIVCDVEGYEQTLLDPAFVPALFDATIVVELHEFAAPGVTATLLGRFGESHRIEHIWQEPRGRSEFPWNTLGTRLLPRRYLDWAVSEWRPERMAWLWMEPRCST